MFYDGVKTSDLVNRDHILKIVFGPFEKDFMKVLF